MMKRYILLLVMTFPLLLNAQSPKKLIDKGEYDKAIEVCVDRLADGKGNKDDLYASLNMQNYKIDICSFPALVNNFGATW